MKPLVSFLVLAYKQERYIKEAVEAALSQTYEPLEIIFSDDCSPDSTFKIIEEITKGYNGPHKVIINRNKKNLGLASHINHVFSIAKGEFFVMAAGDDVSSPNRTVKMVEKWLQNSKVDLVCSFFEEISEAGKPTGFIKKHVTFVPDTTKSVRQWECGATGACAGYSRKIYDKYGPLDPNIIAEDWIFSFRAWLESGIALIEEPLVKHRTHENSISVLHKDINKQKDIEIRKNLRIKNSKEKLARAKEWLKACKISNNTLYKEDFLEWIKMLELEVSTYTGGRLHNFMVTIQILFVYQDVRTAARIFVRQVLGKY